MNRGLRGALVAALAAGSVVVGPVPLLGAGPCAAFAAAGAGRAGVVVQFGDLSVREYCVSFTEPSITGFELLRRTGLALTYQDYGGGSVTVCRIGGEGCDYPREPCFCRCVAGTCTFWGYYTIEASSGLWRFSQLGAGARSVRDGDVDGWRWGQHAQGLGAPPPSGLDGICARGEKVGPSPAGRSRQVRTVEEESAPASEPASPTNAASRTDAAPGPATGRAEASGDASGGGGRPALARERAPAGAAPVATGADGQGAASWAGFAAIVAVLAVWGARLARARRRGGVR